MRRHPFAPIIAVIGITFLVMLGYILFNARSHTATARVNIQVAPAGSKLTINGAAAKAGENTVPVGSATVKASFDGFASQTQTVNLKKGDNTSVLFVLLSNSPSTANWYTSHPDDAQLGSAIASQQFDNNGAASASNVPLIKQLPYIGPGLQFRVDYGVNPAGNSSTNPAIYIDAPTEAGKQAALDWIKSQGFDLSTMKFVFTSDIF